MTDKEKQIKDLAQWAIDKFHKESGLIDTWIKIDDFYVPEESGIGTINGKYGSLFIEFDLKENKVIEIEYIFEPEGSGKEAQNDEEVIGYHWADQDYMHEYIEWNLTGEIFANINNYPKVMYSDEGAVEMFHELGDNEDWSYEFVHDYYLDVKKEVNK